MSEKSTVCDDGSSQFDELNQESHSCPSNKVSKDDLLSKALADALRLATGIDAVELWKFDAWTGRLDYGGGEWRDFGTDTALGELADPTNPDYVPPAPVRPGVGLVGALWAQSPRARTNLPALPPDVYEIWDGLIKSDQSMESRLDWIESLGRNGWVHRGLFGGDGWFGGGCLRRRVRWEDVHALARDPDTPSDLRLRLIERAGYGFAAGCPFNVQGHKGIVLYIAKSLTNQAMLSPLNETYLCCAADLVGAISALKVPEKT